MAGREEEAQQLVAEIIVHGRFDRLDRMGRAVERLVQRPRDLLVLARAHRVAPEGIDGAPFGDGQRVLRRLLGTIDIPHDAGQVRDEPGPFNAKGRFDRPMRLACGHTSFSTKATK